MILTTNDVMFLETINRLHLSQEKQAVRTSQLLLSPELLHLFGVENNAMGFWCMGIYVEFEPAFKTAPAKEWQKV